MQENRFYDTSILVYAYDSTSGAKQEVARKCLRQVFDGGTIGIISTQVLAEFFNVTTTKFEEPIPHYEIESIIKDFITSDHWIKLNYNSSTLKRAISTSVKSNVAIWDALIAETMKESEINTIVTENEKDFKIIPGIKVINPFKD